MRISLIAAMAENRVIGRGTAIPWDIPDDRKRFREITWGHTVVMGRKTFETLDGPLPGRRTIVLTRNQHYVAAGCRVVHGREAALKEAGTAEELFVCGGEEIYCEFLPLADRIFLTVIHRKIDGDVLFPEIPDNFIVKDREYVPEPLPHTFFLYEKIHRNSANKARTNNDYGNKASA